MGLLCLFLKASARNSSEGNGLKPGDRVPDMVISDIINYHSGTVRVSDFRDKILVLDFWATWCGSCIVNFPKMYALQNKLPGELQILLVDCKSTRDDETKIRDFFDKRKGYYGFPTVIMDTALERLFPHRTIPHYVWIRQNTVLAITGAAELSEKNIDKLFKKEAVKLPEKTFIPFDISNPLFADGNGGQPVPALHRSFFAAYKPGLQNYMGFAFNENEMVERVDVLNRSRMELMRFSFAQFSEVNEDRIICNVPDPAYFSSDSTSEAWRKKNCFIYESSFPACTRTAAMAFMQADIQKYLGVRIDSVVREADCRVITIADSGKLVKSKTGARPESNIKEHTGAPVYFSGFDPGSITRRLEDFLKVPFINETGYSGSIEIILPAELKDESALSANLLRQGLLLRKEKRKITFLVINSLTPVPGKSPNL